MYKYHPLTYKKLIKSEDASGAAFIQGTVDTYGDLPAPVPGNDGWMYYVLNGSGGSWIRNQFGFYQYPKGFYISDGTSWTKSEIQVSVAEDAVSLVNINDWAAHFSTNPNYNIGDKIIFDNRWYVNITGTFTSTAPNLDTTNWASEVTDTNGFPSDQRTNTSLSFTNNTRTFAISSVSYPFHYYMLGDKYEKDSVDSVVITDVEGRHYIYYDGETLTSLANPNDDQVDSVIRTKSIVCSLYWNATDSKIEGMISDERHGISMSPDTHSYLHFTQGAKYLNGLAVGDLSVDDVSPNNASGQFSVSSGFTTDEDIITSYPTIGSTIGLPIYYLLGASANMRRTAESGFSVLTDVTAGVGVTGRLVYNEWTGSTWQLSTITSGNYVLCHVFAVNGTGDANGDEKSDQLIAVIGQEEYANAADARLGATTEISNIISGLAAPEIIPVATIIFQTRDNYTGSDILARVVSTIDGDYTDWRTSEIQSGATASSHTNLSNVDTAATGIIQGHVDNSKPLQIPELTTTERDLVTANNGMMIYNTTLDKFQGYENGAWTNLI